MVNGFIILIKVSRRLSEKWIASCKMLGRKKPDKLELKRYNLSH